MDVIEQKMFMPEGIDIREKLPPVRLENRTM